MRGAALLGLALVMGLGARAQTVRLESVVTGVAGAEAYLDRGTDDGLAAGDTVGVERDGAPVGRLAVLQATASRAVATTAGPAFALTRGDRVTLVLRDAAPAVATPLPPAAPPDAPPDALPDRASILTPADAPTRRTSRAGPRLTGRVQTGLTALRSTTTPTVGTAIGRTFASPFASLRADVTGLPGGTRLRLNGRTTYRYADAPGVAGEADLRLYEAALETTGRLVRAQMGRFALPYERASGYWDGAAVQVGTDRAGVGVAGGLQPDRTNGLPGGPSAKAAAYAYAARQTGPVRAQGAVSAGHLFGGTGASFAGLAASVTATQGQTRLTASADALADAGTDGWGLARAALRASVRSGAWRVRAGASRFRPSALTTVRLPTTIAFTPAIRTSVTAGAAVRVGRRGPDVRLDGGVYRRDGQADGTSLGGGVSVVRLPLLPVGLTLDATVRTRGGLTSLYGGATASADVSTARVTAGYRLARTALTLRTLTQHGVEGSLSAPLTRRVGVVVQGGVYGGSGLSRSSLYTSLWVRL